MSPRSNFDKVKGNNKPFLIAPCHSQCIQPFYCPFIIFSLFLQSLLFSPNEKIKVVGLIVRKQRLTAAPTPEFNF